MKFNQAKINRAVTLLSSFALILWGAGLVLAWQFGRLDFVPPAQSPKPLPYFLAISTLLIGIASWLLLYKSHMRIAKLCGALIAIFTVLLFFGLKETRSQIIVLKLYPTELLIQNYLNDTMLYVNLIGGCILALSIGVMLRLWQHSQTHLLQDLENTAEPILDEKKQLIGFRGSDRDVSERIAMEKSKNEFISMISHELRTPLTSIQGSIGLLLKSAENKMHQELLSIAYRNAERLNAIINDILDIQKLQLGKLVFHIAPMSVKEVIQEAISSATALADRAHVSLAIEGELTDVKVMGDARRIMQVIMNLLSNAIKFSKEGSTVFVSMEEHEKTVRTSIRDTGPGIPESFWPKIFEKFVQADTSDSRLIPGTGLGLNISKTIVEHCGGTIHFITEKDKGTTFFFDLPKENNIHETA